MPSPFVRKRGVPILDEHTLKDEDGKVIVTVDRERLEDIAKKNNQRIEQTGDLTPFVIGHTRDGAPEDEQPEIVGYATHFYVKPFAKTGRYALHADSKFFRDKKHLVNKHPRRSVELWTDDWKIDPIALLGATTPERDLGLLQLSRTGRRKIRRVIPYEKTMPFPPTQQSAQGAPGQSQNTQPELGGGDPQVASIVQAVIAGLQETDVWQFFEQQMQEQSAMDMAPDPLAGGQPPLPPEAGDQDLFPGDDADGDGFDDEGEYDEEGEEEDDEEPVRMSASSMPSGTNTFTPPGSRRQMSRPTQTPRPRRQQYAAQPQSQIPRDLLGRLRSAADARRIQYARQEQRLQVQDEEIRRLKYQNMRDRREKDLIQLEAEGVVLDRVEELDFVASMPETAYQKYVSQVRKRYQRAPIGRLNYSAEDFRAGSGAERDRDSVARIVEHATSRGISYEQAVRDLEGQ